MHDGLGLARIIPQIGGSGAVFEFVECLLFAGEVKVAHGRFQSVAVGSPVLQVQSSQRVSFPHSRSLYSCAWEKENHHGAMTAPWWQGIIGLAHTSDGVDFGHQAGEVLERQRLRTVGCGFVGIWVHLDHQPIGTGGQACECEWRHQVPFAGAV